VYYESTKVAYEQHAVADRPIALSRDNGPNWKAGPAHSLLNQTLRGAGSPAHHRFPVWWTGDSVPLMADVGAMVEEAVHDFRSFVHSDCGGHGQCTHSKVPGAPPPPPPENAPCMDENGEPSPSNTALLRWTAHCVVGTIVRFHQGDPRFWLRDTKTQNSARSYLNLRYKLAPSLIGWGVTVQKAGFPLTVRCTFVFDKSITREDAIGSHACV
jgi:alpha-glucosidase (family GH31 glycosyl hydrolase)